MAARLTAFVVSAIVAITFVAGLIVGAQREDDSGPIDLIVYNAHIYGGDPAKGFAEAIAVRGNRILRVGSNHDIKRLMRRATTLVDAHGGSVLPGFNDAGLDLFAEGFELDAVRQTIADAHRVGLTSAHVVLRSADDLVLLEDLEKRGELTLRVSAALTATLPIDAAEVDRLEAIRRLHPGDALLRAASVRLVVPVGGIQEIADRAASGRVVGVAAAATTAAATTGVAAANVGAAASASGVANANARAHGNATASSAARAAGAVGASAHVTGTVADRADRADRHAGTTGTTGAVGAAAAHHARGRKVPAPVVITADTLATAIGMLDQRGWQVIVAPADAAGVEMTLAAFQEALQTPRLDNSPRRHRIELPAPLDAPTSARFDSLGIIQSFQSAAAPPTVAATAGEGDAAPTATAAVAATTGASASTSAASAAGSAVTTTATKATTVTASLAEAAASLAGAPVAAAPATAAAPLAGTVPATRLAPISARAIFRSDWPARPLDPRITLAAATVVEDSPAPASDDAAKPAVTDKERAAWLARAIDAYTSRAAYATFDETRKGTLAKDMLADFVIFTTDLFDPKSTTAITDTTITTTIANGRTVYTAVETKPTLSTAP